MSDILTWMDLGELRVNTLEHHADGESGALLIDAAFSVEALVYLLMVDEKAFAADADRPFGQHPQVVNSAHVRWCAATAVTAIDLCAAVVGRLDRLPRKPPREADLGSILSSSAKLRPECVAWAESARDDGEYKTILEIRNSLIHRRMGGVVYLGNVPRRQPGHLDPRQDYRLGDGRELGSRAILELAVRVAARHVRSFSEQVVRALPAPVA